MTDITRRRFVTLMGVSAAGILAAPLTNFYAREAIGRPSFGPGFGSLSPKLPENTASLANTAVGDLRNIPLLELPDGFIYWAHSITGQTMSDGTLVPGRHDGMATFDGPQGTTILVRNHELSPHQDAYGNTRGVDVISALKYDPACSGGTTTLVIDNLGRLISHYASLGGTCRNCAGGPTPWGSWISCEENVSTPETDGNVSKRHGYNFEVPAHATGPVEAIPLRAMGRFNHEAIAVDPATGYVYQTEDRRDSCFYRYRPERYGDLAGGGVLEALIIRGRPAVNTATGFQSMVGVPMDVEWVVIEEVDPAGDTLRLEAQSKGAALFSRGEGTWYGNGLVYFVCTTGGDAGKGQVWAYNPADDTIMLLVESPASSMLDHPDNITVGPDGRLYLCENGGGIDRIVGVTANGKVYTVANNAYDTSEFAGVCFSHDGRFMFVNSQGIGITYLIGGPWRKDRR